VIATRFRRPVAASLLAAATVVAALLPPAHIHLAAHDDHDHDHAAAIEHSHWSSHGGASRAALDDDDGRAIYVDRPAIASQVDAAIARPATAVVALLSLPAPATFTVAERTTSGNSPRDGPTRGPALLRAPPAFVTL
jgi:hypothetical protein